MEIQFRDTKYYVFTCDYFFGTRMTTEEGYSNIYSVEEVDNLVSNFIISQSEGLDTTKIS